MARRISAQPTFREHYASDARLIPDYGLPAIRLLNPVQGERILDLGCGDGTLTRELIEAGSTVVAIDREPRMVELAIAEGIDARIVDGAKLSFASEFDAVFSNAALHYMRPIGDVVAGVARALTPGGRFVGELGAHGNIAAITTAFVAVLGEYEDHPSRIVPWYFPTSDEYCDILESCGFVVETVQTLPRPTALPHGLLPWIDTFGGWCLNRIPEHARASARLKIAGILEPALRNHHGDWIADYVRLRFRASIPPHARQ